MYVFMTFMGSYSRHINKIVHNIQLEIPATVPPLYPTTFIQNLNYLDLPNFPRSKFNYEQARYTTYSPVNHVITTNYMYQHLLSLARYVS